MCRDGPLRLFLPRPLPRNRADSLDAGVRPAAGVLLQLHPARELSRHRRRLPARDAAAQPVRLVPADPVRGDRRGRPCCGSKSRCRARRRSIFRAARPQPVVPVESTLLLPLLFIAVAALFVTVAQRMGRELTGAAAAARLRDQPARQPRRRRRVRARLVARAAADASGSASPRPRRCRSSSQDRRLVAAVNVALLAGVARRSCIAWRAAACGRRTTASRSSRTGRTPSSR